MVRGALVDRKTMNRYSLALAHSLFLFLMGNREHDVAYQHLDSSLNRPRSLDHSFPNYGKVNCFCI